MVGCPPVVETETSRVICPGVRGQIGRSSSAMLASHWIRKRHQNAAANTELNFPEKRTARRGFSYVTFPRGVGHGRPSPKLKQPHFVSTTGRLANSASHIFLTRLAASQTETLQDKKEVEYEDGEEEELHDKERDPKLAPKGAHDKEDTEDDDIEDEEWEMMRMTRRMSRRMRMRTRWRRRMQTQKRMRMRTITRMTKRMEKRSNNWNMKELTMRMRLKMRRRVR